MEVKNINQETKDAENIPSVFVDYELLNFDTPQASQTMYKIDGKTYKDNLDVRDGFEEFKLCAERIGVKRKENEMPVKKMQFEVQIAYDDYIINSAIFLNTRQYNAMTSDHDNCLHCRICDEIVLEEKCDIHVARKRHKKNIQACPLVEEYGLDMFRLIKDNYHCCLCNELLDKSTDSSHLKSQTHVYNKIYASQKAAEIIIQINASVKYKNNDVKYNNNDVKNNNNDTRNKNNDKELNEKTNRNKNLAIDSRVSVKTEKKVFDIAYFSWHMISISKSKENFHCMACKTRDSNDNLDKHIGNILHEKNLETFIINDSYEDHLIRQDTKWSHCSTCNTIHYLDGTELHLMKHDIGKTSSKKWNSENKNNENKNKDNRNENNDAPSKSYPCEDIRFVVANTYDSRDYALIHLLENENCYVYLFGFQIEVSLLSLNVIFHYNTDFYCGLCKIVFNYQYLQDHINYTMHTACLASTPALQYYGFNYIRWIHNQPHCGICHMFVLPSMLWCHLQNPSHIMQANVALGLINNINLLPPAPRVVRVMPNVKIYDENVEKKIEEKNDNNDTNEIENKISETKERIDETKNIINDSKNTIDLMRNIINKTRNSIDETKNIINDAKNTTFETKNTIYETIKTFEETTSIINDTKNTTIGTNTTINDTKNTINLMMNIIQKTKNKINDTKNTTFVTEYMVPEPLKTIDETKNTGIIEDTKNVIVGTKNTINETDSINLMRNIINETRNNIDQTKNDFDKIRNDIDETRNDIDETRNDFDETKNDIDEDRNDINRTKNIINKSKDTGKIDDSKSSTIETNNTNNETENTINIMRNETRNDIDENQNDIIETNTKNTTGDLKDTILETIKTIGVTKNTGIIEDTNNATIGTKNTIHETKNSIDEPKTEINDTKNTINESNNELTISRVNVNKKETKKSDNEIDMYTELNKCILLESNEDIFDAEVEIVMTTGRMQIYLTSFNTLVPVGDGDRYCFVCRVAVGGDMLKNHICSENHMENMRNLKFLESYHNNLIRQNTCLYHCAICNTIVRRHELLNHIQWTTHKERRNKINISVTNEERETEEFQKELFPTQNEGIYSSKHKDITTKGTYVINEKTPHNEIIMKNDKKIIIQDLNLNLVLKWDSWHSMLRHKRKYTCIICSEKMDHACLGDHLNSDGHKMNLDKPILKEYLPALIRKINSHLWHCLVCNTALYLETTLYGHINNKYSDHKSNFVVLLKSSEEAEEINPNDVLIL